MPSFDKPKFRPSAWEILCASPSSDTGTGMEGESIIKRIFEPSVPPRRSARDGLGLPTA